MTNMSIDDFLGQYDELVCTNAHKLRVFLAAELPGITEQAGIPARMVAYCYGQRYIDMICTIIPSKKGIKLGFAYGVELPDPDGLLQGEAKLSRYVEIKTGKEIGTKALKKLLSTALAAYKKRIKDKEQSAKT